MDLKELKEIVANHTLWEENPETGARADLSNADLSNADLRNAKLRGANLSGANLSGVEGFDASAWLTEHLEQDDLGLIAYKRIGQTSYPTPAHWEIAPGKFITETVNPDRGTECGSGVNVGTRAWCETHYRGTALWRCRIRWIDLAGVVVPFDTDGKFRASRVELLEVVDK